MATNLFTNEKIREISITLRNYMLENSIEELNMEGIHIALLEKEVMDDSLIELDKLFQFSWDDKLECVDGLYKRETGWIVAITPAILYHYTTTDTLIKIFEGAIEKEGKINLTFRATNILYMNDPTETKYFIEHLCDSIDELNNANENKESQNWIREWFAVNPSTNYARIEERDTYILSLSECSDDLLMWRGYGATGKGVAIGFDFHSLLNHFQKDIFKCFYAKKETIKELASNNLDYINSGITVTPNPGGGNVVFFDENIESFLKQKRLSCKHPAYIEEKEWRVKFEERFIPRHPPHKGNEKIKFASKEGFIYPYITFDLPSYFIKEVIIGPCAENELSRRAVHNLLLLKTDSNYLTVRYSQVPFIAR